jgi:homoserine kinase
MESVTAFAPASVGNVGVGFDVIGHALDAAGDRVKLRRTPNGRMSIVAIRGLVTDLPRDPASNTAARALAELMRRHDVREGVELTLDKGIPLGSGMGGSAASAVAAVVAGDALWGLGATADTLLSCALEGERAASGTPHADNVAPSLLGGLVLSEPGDPPHCTRLPVPDDIVCVLCHPALSVRTADARRILAPATPLAAWVRQSGWLAGFVAGCLRGDRAQLARCLRDEIIGPQRLRLVPGAAHALAAVREAGALGASLSGSGPSVFAWCEAASAAAAAAAFRAAFRAAGVDCECWVSPVDAPGARVVTDD